MMIRVGRTVRGAVEFCLHRAIEMVAVGLSYGQNPCFRHRRRRAPRQRADATADGTTVRRNGAVAGRKTTRYFALKCTARMS